LISSGFLTTLGGFTRGERENKLFNREQTRRRDHMKASLLCVLVLAFLVPPLCGFYTWEHFADPGPMAQSLSEYFEPGAVQPSEPMPIKQIIGLVIAGLALFVILLFVFSFLMGPGERIREKISETSDPFFTIVLILLVVLLLAMVQNYYNEILDWLKTVVSSG
jgi:hypothetical protein